MKNTNLTASSATAGYEPAPATSGFTRGGAVVAHVAHNHEVAGSIPAPATLTDAGSDSLPRNQGQSAASSLGNGSLKALAARVAAGAVTSRPSLSLAACQPALRIYNSASRTVAATLLSRLLSAAGAPVLTRQFTSVSPGRLTRCAPFPWLQLPPMPARFFFEPTAPDRRVVWWLGINGGLV